MNWPRYMMDKRPERRRDCLLLEPAQARPQGRVYTRREKLGQTTRGHRRAAELNHHLDDWRAGRGETKELDLRPATARWRGWSSDIRDAAWKKVSKRSRYRIRAQRSIWCCDHKLKNGIELGTTALAPI